MGNLAHPCGRHEKKSLTGFQEMSLTFSVPTISGVASDEKKTHTINKTQQVIAAVKGTGFLELTISKMFTAMAVIK